VLFLLAARLAAGICAEFRLLAVVVEDGLWLLTAGVEDGL
jgi:hypothetical protein